MMRKWHAPRIAVVLLLLAAIPAVLWLSNRQHQGSGTQRDDGGPSDKSEAESVHAEPVPPRFVPPGASAETEGDDPAGNLPLNVTSSERVVLDHIDRLLSIGLGRVTASQAQEQIREIIGLPGALSVLRRKLTEGSLSEKLLSVYALIEANEFPDGLFQTVLEDSSPFVQAAAFHLLFRNGDFERADALIEERMLTLDWNTASALLDQGSAKPTLQLPVALSRIGLGDGLPLYLDLLADHSPSLRLAAFTRLTDPGVTLETQSLLLGLVDSTPDQELVERLKLAFENESNRVSRIQIAQYIAARSTQQDQQLVAYLTSGLGQTPAGIPPVELQFRETWIEKLRGHEQMIERVMSSNDFDPVALNGALAAYLKEGEMVGVHMLSRDTLNAVTAFLRGRNFTYAPDIIARGEYAARQLK